MDHKTGTIYGIFAYTRPASDPALVSRVLDSLVTALEPIGAHRQRLDATPGRLKRKRAADAAHKISHDPFIIGFNAVTASLSDPKTALYAVFVCRADVLGLVTSHFPGLCRRRGVRLCDLPAGSEARLGKAIGLPRVSVIAICKDHKDDENLNALYQFIDEHLAASPTNQTSGYRPVEIETLTTYVPIKIKSK